MSDTDPGIRQIRDLTWLLKAGVPSRVALSLVKLRRALERATNHQGRWQR